MAKEVSYEESLFTHSLFTFSESPLDVMMNHVLKANVVSNEKSLSQMEQLEAGLPSHVDGGKKKKKNATKGKKKKQKVNGNVGNARVSRETKKALLALAEQARRRRKANLYKDVRALLPHLPPKADQAAVLEETIGVIMSLKQTVASLENEKLKRLYNAFNETTMASPLDDVTSQSLAVYNEPPAPMMTLNNNSGPSSVTIASPENENLGMLYNASNYTTMASPLDVTSQSLAVYNEPPVPMMTLNNNSGPSSVTIANPENEKLEMLCNASNYTTMASPLDVTSQSLAVYNETPAPMMTLNNNSGPSAVTFKTWTESNVTISACGIDANISICSLKNPNLLSTVCYILEKHNLEVVFAQVSSDHAKTMYMVHVRANVPDEFAEGFPYEEMYKKVVAKINVFAEF